MKFTILNTMPRLLSTLALLLGFCLSYASALADKLVCCGREEVFIIDAETNQSLPIKKLWSWKAAERKDLPESFRSLFRTTDDCKPVAGGSRILISASSGGLALVEYPSGKVIWYAKVGNAHSVELLPNDRIAVAGSTHDEGNRVAIYDIRKPDQQLFHEELYSGHGVVWDSRRERLWALGFDELRAYHLEDWETNEPRLKLMATHKLPSPGGHDLSPLPSSTNLIVTASKNVFIFDRDTGSFTEHETLGNEVSVKCVSVHPKTGRTAWTQGEDGEWWSPHIRFLNPEGVLKLEGERLYKVRWLVDK
jgi:hypothetical protein